MKFDWNIAIGCGVVGLAAVMLHTMIYSTLIYAQPLPDPDAIVPPHQTIWDGYEAEVQRAMRRSPGGFYAALTDTLVDLPDPSAVVEPLLQRLGLVLPPGVDPIEGTDARDLNRIYKEVERTLGATAAEAMLDAARESADGRR